MLDDHIATLQAARLVDFFLLMTAITVTVIVNDLYAGGEINVLYTLLLLWRSVANEPHSQD